MQSAEMPVASGRRTKRFIVFALGSLALSLAWLGCDSNDPDQVDPDYVVESYLIAGEPLRQVRVSRTQPLEGEYVFANAAVRGADVRVDLLDDLDQVEESYSYFGLNDLYVPSDQNVVVQPMRTYRLTVRAPDGTQISSSTLVPGDFEIVRINADSVKFQGPTQFEVDVTRSAYPGRQAIFVFSVEGLDPAFETLTPLYEEIVDPDPDTPLDDLNEFLITESPPVNEDNYDINADGTLTIRLPWLAVAFYGPNRIIANAVDDNLYDFVRSHQVQQGGSTLAPGEIPNVLDHVDGGTGIFGSFARVSTEVYIGRN